MSKAELFIGIDSSFAHFANALNIKGIILLGHYRAFKTYMPYTGYYTYSEGGKIINSEGAVSEIGSDLVKNEISKIIYS
ncbi:hypothetical protein D3C78_1377400 [compost metagenome]